MSARALIAVALCASVASAKTTTKVPVPDAARMIEDMGRLLAAEVPEQFRESDGARKRQALAQYLLDHQNEAPDGISAEDLARLRQGLAEIRAQMHEFQNFRRENGLVGRLNLDSLPPNLREQAEAYFRTMHRITDETTNQLDTQILQRGMREVFNPGGDPPMRRNWAQWNASRSPESPVARTSLGRAQQDDGDPKGALASFNAARQMDPKNVEAAAGAAGANLDLKNYDQANADARAALELDPNNREALTVEKFTEGRVSGSGGMDTAKAGAASIAAGATGAGGGSSARMMAAAAASKAAAARMSGEQAARAAQNALSLGDAASARAYADRALEQNPQDAAALAIRAQINLRARAYAETLSDASAGLALNPRDQGLMRLKGVAEVRSGRYRDAVASANALIEGNPQDAYGYALRAQAYGQLGDREAYKADIEKAASLDPRYKKAAAEAGTVQLPSDQDVLFLFPGEEGTGPKSAAPAPAQRNQRFGALMMVSVAGGLLLALGLLQLVKDKVSSVFTRVTRTGPTVQETPDDAAPTPAGGGIRDKYDLARQIGQGGMGVVYEGTDRSLGRRVALKKMRDELRHDATERARFVAEAKTVAALRHPNIVDIYSIVEDAGDVYLVFEFVDGKTVHELVQSRGKLDADAAVRVVAAAAEALEYAHGRGVIHRDMKPSNMMVDSAGRVKVMDFGIARVAKDAMTRYSRTNTVVGTPPYMAPEQEQGRIYKESDVYALAVCAYEMLTGRLPFAGIGGGMLLNKINMSFVPPSQAAGLPTALDSVFQRAFQAEPEKRYRTPKEFASALRSALPSAVRA